MLSPRRGKCIVEILPKLAVLLKINDDSGLLTVVIDDVLDPFHGFTSIVTAPGQRFRISSAIAPAS